MAQQLLWIETLLKLAGGLVLALVPLSAARVLGLPTAASAFWPRLLGAVLVGIAAASFVQGRGAAGGLGLGGAIFINLAASTMLISLLVLRRAATTRRGKVLLWTLAIGLLVLAFVEVSAV